MIITPDYIMSFGKYKFSTAESVMVVDASYLLWCEENVAWFELDPDFQTRITKHKETQDEEFSINKAVKQSYGYDRIDGDYDDQQDDGLWF